MDVVLQAAAARVITQNLAGAAEALVERMTPPEAKVEPRYLVPGAAEVAAELPQ